MTPVPLHLNHEPFSFFVGTLTISFSHPGTNFPIQRRPFLGLMAFIGKQMCWHRRSWAGYFLGHGGLLEVNAGIFQFLKIKLGFINGMNFRWIETEEANARKGDFNQRFHRVLPTRFSCRWWVVPRCPTVDIIIRPPAELARRCFWV